MSDEIVRPDPVGLSHIGISVTDLDRSVAFYCDVLGGVVLQPPAQGKSTSSKWRMALVALGSLGLDIYQHTANGGEDFAPSHTGLDHVGFAVASRDDLESWARWLDSRGVERSEIRDVGAGDLFDFTDPDGIQLEFFFLDLDRLGEQP